MKILYLRVLAALWFLAISGLAYAQVAGNSCDCWVTPDASYTLINNNADWNASGFNSSDDGSFGPVALPFAFDLYGQNYTQAWININGNVTFDTYLTGFSAAGFPAGALPPQVPETVMVAPFWGDVDLGTGFGLNQVYYKITPTALYVNWVDVSYYGASSNLVNTFQLIITDGTDPVVPNGANVSFCYQDMQWTTGTASGGSAGFGGTPANVGANKGDGINYLQFGRFDQPGNTYDGPFGNNDGVDWLDNLQLTFTTDSASANVPPIVASQSVCDTLGQAICVGDVVNLQASFIAPEPTQTTVATSNAPTLSNYTVVSNTTGIVADIATQFIPTLADTGYHTITFSGTDNGTPVLTTSITMVVFVQPAASTQNLSTTICGSAPPVNLFGLLSNIAPGGAWVDSAGNAFSGVFDPLLNVSGTYQYTDTSAGICASNGFVNVSLLPIGTAGLNNQQSLCSLDPLFDLNTLLDPTASPGGFWQDPLLNASNGLVNPSTDPAGDYMYVILNPFPCSNDTAFMTIVIEQAPDAGVSALVDACAADAPFDMFNELGGTPDATGSWLSPTFNPVSSILDPSISTPGLYTYVVLGAVACDSDSSEIFVSIDPVPNAGTDNTLALCEYESPVDLFNLLGLADSGGDWLAPSNLAHSGLLNPAVDSTGNYFYLVDGVGECNYITDSAFVAVAVSPEPVLTFTADSLASCAPFLVNFQNTSDIQFLNGTCSWNFGDGNAVNDCNSMVPYTYTNPGIYPVSLSVTTLAGCTATVVQSPYITVDPAPSAGFIISPNPTNLDNTVVSVTATDLNVISWEWDLELFGSFTGDSSITNTYPNVLPDDYTICLEVFDQYGCSDTLCQILEITDLSVFLPNAFTANGDGLNDTFLPRVTDYEPADFEFTVWDRWGRLAFESTDPNVPWIGSVNNSGDLLPEGVYVWRMLVRGLNEVERREYNGHVTLLR